MKKRAITICVLVLTSFTFIAAVPAAESVQSAAESDQIRIDRFISEHYAGFIKDYLNVFIADFECDYGFVNGPEFDQLADQALNNLTTSVSTVLKERSNRLKLDMSPQQLEYTANLVALSSIEKHVHTYTVDLGKERGPGPTACEANLENDKALYEGLPARLKMISQQEI